MVLSVAALLALYAGNYPVMQSFEAWQLATPRDLPPTGPGPLEDVLFVIAYVNNPASTAARAMSSTPATIKPTPNILTPPRSAWGSPDRGVPSSLEVSPALW